MAAFQQRRQTAARPASLHASLSSDQLSQSLHRASEDEDAVVLFSPPRPATNSLADSTASWHEVQPRAPLRRTSYASTASTDSRSTTSASLSEQSSLGSPLPTSSLLPAHDGNGVFNPTESLVHSTDALPSLSLYASAVDAPSPSSTSLASTASFPLHHRRPSVLSHLSFDSTFSLGSQGSHDESWGQLTEENLAASSQRHAAQEGSNSSFDPVERDSAHEDDQDSVGYTSGSEEEAEQRAKTPRKAGEGKKNRSTSSAARRALADRQQEQHDEFALSAGALSAGLSSAARPRRPSSTATLSSAAAARRRLLPSSGSLVSLPRGISPARTATSASLSTTSQKRRHRRAGGRAGSQSSQKRSSVAGSERARRKEVERQERMRRIVREREEERRRVEGFREKEGEMLFGHAVLSYLHIPPSHLSLIASTPATEDPTPVPSPRSSSPTGFARFGAAASADGFGGMGRAFLGQDRELADGEVSDAETEHPDASPASPSASSRALPTRAEGEALLLAPPSPTSSSSPSSAAAGAERTAWGGEFDSLEFALSYWRGFLRRLGVFEGRRAGQEEGEEGGGEELADPTHIVPVLA
ncbi:hypothetical protein JCM8097_008992 [Rhodosporidiobolus ruineniae]